MILSFSSKEILKSRVLLFVAVFGFDICSNKYSEIKSSTFLVIKRLKGRAPNAGL